jgi:hypothetical protein
MSGQHQAATLAECRVLNAECSVLYNAKPTLMRRLREILRNEYIGAIAIGFLLFQAIGNLISAVMQPVAAYIQNRNRPQSVFSPSQSVFNWPQIIFTLIEMSLHLIVALLLIFWLYRKRKEQPAAVTESTVVSSKQPQTQP